MINNFIFFLSINSFRCLGLKSPFIEFKADIEVLSNLSISLNTSDTSGFGNSMMSGNPFSYPMDMAHNITIQKQYLELMKHQQITTSSTENPIVVAAMNSKKEVTLIESRERDNGERSIDHVDRKYIIPLALKTQTPAPRKAPVLPDTSPNIDDLKRHILMLQNLTKNDENFQSKFVVFPNLQRNATATVPIPTTMDTTITTTTSTTTSTTTTTQRPSTVRTTRANYRLVTKRRPILVNAPKQSTTSAEEVLLRNEKITIVPQVFLQNDQTPMNDDSFERSPDRPSALNSDQFAYQGSNRREVHTSYERQTKLNKSNQRKSDNNDSKPTFLNTSTKKPLARRNNVGQTLPKKNRDQNRGEQKQLRRQMRKTCKQLPLDQQENCTRAFELKFNLTSASSRRNGRNKNKEAPMSSTNEFSLNGSRAKSNYVPIRPAQLTHAITNQRTTSTNADDEALKQSILQRTIRSHHRHQRRNASALATSRDYIYPIGASASVNETTVEAAAAAYKEQIDLNPDLCYKVGGLSYGQQKLCVSHTQIMPAISRGARAAIQVI